eukprot:scaffold14458_cov66-Phaeocystis_antarctica.AAC.1
MARCGLRVRLRGRRGPHGRCPARCAGSHVPAPRTLVNTREAQRMKAYTILGSVGFTTSQ